MSTNCNLASKSGNVAICSVAKSFGWIKMTQFRGRGSKWRNLGEIKFPRHPWTVWKVGPDSLELAIGIRELDALCSPIIIQPNGSRLRGRCQSLEVRVAQSRAHDRLHGGTTTPAKGVVDTAGTRKLPHRSLIFLGKGPSPPFFCAPRTWVFVLTRVDWKLCEIECW